MKIRTRLLLLFAFLGGSAVGLEILRRHVEAAGPLPAGALGKPLAELPLELGQWKGADRIIEDENLLYADAHLQRQYVHPSGQALSLWMAFSHAGADRRHHPEVCMAVAGKPEDLSARQTLDVPGHAVPVQQYRFGRTGDYQLVFYWHYTLQTPPDDRDVIQRIYQKLRQRPASLTIEVFVPERSQQGAEHAREFVQRVDAAVREFVGPEAVRGSRRLAVTITEGE